LLDAYLRDKLSLYTQSSDFACDDACARFGCRSDLVVAVSLHELCGQGGFLKTRALDVFDAACRLSPSIDQGLDKARVRIVVRKPCVFLDSAMICSIHAVRPAVCALFPEHLALLTDEERQSYIRDNGLETYPCVSRSAGVSAARKEVLRRLRLIHTREILATEIYLFGCAGFAVDLRSDIVDASATIEATVPFAAVEASLDRLLKKGGMYHAVRQKIAALDEGRTGDLAGALAIAEVIA
jgi:Fe-S-cluster containining protein